MRMYDLILKKRNGGTLTEDEITYMIDGYTREEIPDYQMAAMMMAIYFVGMNDRETLDLTQAMAASGDRLDLSAIPGIKVDKHSTGGVGDKTSMALGPMVAACGIPVAKMSGRGLGHTGGTIDKLESFPGFTTDLAEEQFIRQVRDIGIAIMGQTADLAPADKKLYALRDVTGTVDNLSLIASSIMSKKLAAGADAIVLDVKTGSGAFMKQEKDAKALAREMVSIGRRAGRAMVAVISDMDQPLGQAVGNALEVKEAISTLRGRGPADFTELCLTLGSQMLVCGGKSSSPEEAREMLLEAVRSGRALEKLADLAEAQGGRREDVYHPEHLPQASIQEEIPAPASGYIRRILCDEVGMSSLILGGGREKKGDPVDLAVGFQIYKKAGDYVEKGEPLAVMHANDETKAAAARERFLNAYEIGCEQPEKRPLIVEIIKT